MSDYTHLWKVGQPLRWHVNDFEGDFWHKGTVKEVYPDHIIADIPEICDHCWFDDFNMGDIYPEYNFTMLKGA